MSETKQWHQICSLADIVNGGKIGKLFRGQHLLIIRFGDEVYCYEDLCPHAGAPLCDGKMSHGQLTCRHHQWKFDLRNGKSLRPTGHKLKSFEVRIENENVFVELENL